MSRSRKTDSGETVQSVTRALMVLELMAKENNVISLSELAKKAGLKMTTIHRILNTLMSRGFVEQDRTTLKYRLGVKVFEIGNAALMINDLRSIAHPFLQQLAGQVNETINLAVLDGTEVVYIDQIESTNIVIVRMFARVGSRGPAYCTGTGKVLLADLPADELIKRLSEIELLKFTENTITDIAQLVQILAQVKKEGYAFDFSERDLGVNCVAVPVRDSSGRVQAAISVSAPEQRMSLERIHQEILPAILAISDAISKQLGFIKSDGKGPN